MKSNNKTIKKNIYKQKKKKHNKTFKYKDTCGPSSTNDYTCYSDKSLLKMKKLWNTRHPDIKIESSKPRDIWNSLKHSMKNVCNNEKCWLKQQFIENNLTPELSLYTFAPTAPKEWLKNPTTWLNSNDITKVMKQYEDKYDNFDFIGPSPIDFDTMVENKCVWPEICNFDLIKHIKKNKSKIGFIFNLDKHNMGGSHWLATYVDVNNKYILFFNSTGEKPTPEIEKLIERIINQGKTINLELKYFENKKEHQRENTECGVYCLYCITELLENNKNPEYFLTHRIPDKKMEELRYHYFNNYNNDINI